MSGNGSGAPGADALAATLVRAIGQLPLWARALLGAAAGGVCGFLIGEVPATLAAGAVLVVSPGTGTVSAPEFDAARWVYVAIRALITVLLGVGIAIGFCRAAATPPPPRPPPPRAR